MYQMGQKQASLTRKCHNHRTQTYSRHSEEETWQQEDNQNKATTHIFLSEMIAKIERTLSTALQNKNQHTKPLQTSGTTVNYQLKTTEPSP